MKEPDREPDIKLPSTLTEKIDGVVYMGRCELHIWIEEGLFKRTYGFIDPAVDKIIDELTVNEMIMELCNDTNKHKYPPCWKAIVNAHIVEKYLLEGDNDDK